MDLNTAISGVFSVIRNASEPFGTEDPQRPNISATLWRTLSDQVNKVYYYESTTSPDVFWVELKDLDFSGKTMQLLVNEGQLYVGNASKQFKAAEPFKFLEAL